MVEPTGGDPLGDRIRATFRAEQADIERRAATRASRPHQPRWWRWWPVAGAAVVVVLLGLLYVSARTDDQPRDIATPTDVTEGDPAATTPPSPTVASTPGPTVAATPPPATPTGVPFSAATNHCDETFDAGPKLVWGIGPDDPDGGLVAHSAVGVDAPVTRVLPADAVVFATGGCSPASNGAAWYELTNEGGGDWVNATYLQTPQPACLTGEQYGTRFPDSADAEQIFGPLDGPAAASGDRIAFAPNESTTYRWYPAEAISFEECFGTGPVQAACLAGQIRVIRPTEAEAIWTGAGPISALRTGTLLPVLQPQGIDLVEVQIIDGPDTITGFVHPTEVDISDGPCVSTGADDLSSVPCTRQPFSGSSLGVAGDPGSEIDHVHDIRTETSDECTRVVIEYGRDLIDTDGAEPHMPQIEVTTTDTSVSVYVVGDRVQSAFEHPQRVQYPSGQALLSVSFDYRFTVELLHAAHEAHIRFMQGPARVVVELFPLGQAAGVLSGPFGEDFVIREPIQRELTGAGISPDVPIVVEGFGRPFEAQGLYRIWSVPADVDPATFLADPPPPDIENILRTSAWAEGWGTFSVELPSLEPGTYIAVFGELPPADHIGFYGAGQLFRIADDPPTPSAPGPFPPAVLLPAVELPVVAG